MQERIQLISFRDVELEKTIDHCRMLKKMKKYLVSYCFSFLEEIFCFT